MGKNYTYVPGAEFPYQYKYEHMAVTTDCVIFTYEDWKLKVLLVRRGGEPYKGQWAFPGGFLKMDETAEQGALRELREETGLSLMRIDEVWKPSYSAVGFSNERNVVVVGVAGGEIRPSDSEVEEIQAVWFDKAQIRELLKDERLSARTQTYCALWSRT